MRRDLPLFQDFSMHDLWLCSYHPSTYAGKEFFRNFSSTLMVHNCIARRSTVLHTTGAFLRCSTMIHSAKSFHDDDEVSETSELPLARFWQLQSICLPLSTFYEYKNASNNVSLKCQRYAPSLDESEYPVSSASILLHVINRNRM